MRLIFIIQVFSYLLRRYSFLFYRGKIAQASGMTKQNTQFLFFIPERRLSYEKIVQMSEKASSLLECFSECRLSYEKIK